MRTALIFALATLTVGCDVQESPKEEAQEAVEAVKDGTKDIGEEMGDVIDASGDKIKEEVDKATA